MESTACEPRPTGFYSAVKLPDAVRGGEGGESIASCIEGCTPVRLADIMGTHDIRVARSL